MVSLSCKNCGGTIHFNVQTNTITCESCGSSQALNSALNPSDTVYEIDSEAGAKINSYQRALNMMSNATSVDSLKTALIMFERLSGTLNADALAKECKDRIELMVKEQKYQQALLDMNSEEPETVISAQNVFNLLENYKDSSQKSDECNQLIERARILQEVKKEKERQRVASRKRKFRLFGIAVIIVIGIIVFARNYTFSSARYEVAIEPTKENYLTQIGKKYEFLYDVEIENKGFLDIVAIECEVIIEKGKDVVADTTMSYYNYSSVAVRKGKTSKFRWKLTTDSTYVAEQLYYNFDDLDVRVEVTQIQFKNGKIKVY